MQFIKFIVFISFLGSSFNLSGQNQVYKELNKKDKEKFKSAQSKHKQKELDKALKTYCKLLDKYSGNPDVELWTGLAYKDLGKNKEALSHLTRATIEGSSKNALLYSTIGEIHKSEQSYIEASEYYAKYLELADPSARGYAKVKRLYDESIFASIQIENPVAFNPIPLDNNVNTLTSEYLPQFTADHSTLYFTRRIKNQEDIFFAEKIENGYSKSKSFDLINTVEFDEGAHTISADGNTFIFTHHDDKYGVGGHDLYMTSKTEEGEWGRPKNMGKNINSIHWDSQPSLSGDGNILFFSSKREGGFGGRDIWYSVFGKDGYWSKPINAGDLINTSGDESSPFLHADMRTLYFRSNGHIGMGNFDLYVARRQRGGGWSEVSNLGYPINTDGQEGALTISLDGTKGYFATDKNGETIENHLDIYEFVLPMSIRPEPCSYIKIRSVDGKTKMPIGSTLEIIDMSTNTILSSKKMNVNGEVLLPIPLRKEMMINVNAEGYVFYSDNILLDTITHGMQPFEKTIRLLEIPKASEVGEGSSFVLKNIFFESGTAELRDISMTEIKKLGDILKENKELKVKIIGHTDDVGSESDNIALSKNRAESVKDALVSLDIPSYRFITEGKGESEPIADNQTAEGRLLNRRTEFVLY